MRTRQKRLRSWLRDRTSMFMMQSMLPDTLRPYKRTGRGDRIVFQRRFHFGSEPRSKFDGGLDRRCVGIVRGFIVLGDNCRASPSSALLSKDAFHLKQANDGGPVPVLPYPPRPPAGQACHWKPPVDLRRFSLPGNCAAVRQLRPSATAKADDGDMATAVQARDDRLCFADRAGGPGAVFELVTGLSQAVAMGK